MIFTPSTNIDAHEYLIHVEYIRSDLLLCQFEDNTRDLNECILLMKIDNHCPQKWMKDAPLYT